MKLRDMFSEEGGELIGRLSKGTTFDEGVRLGFMAAYGSLRVSGKIADAVVKVFGSQITISEFLESAGEPTLDEYMEKIADAIEVIKDTTDE